MQTIVGLWNIQAREVKELLPTMSLSKAQDQKKKQVDEACMASGHIRLQSKQNTQSPSHSERGKNQDKVNSNEWYFK